MKEVYENIIASLSKLTIREQNSVIEQVVLQLKTDRQDKINEMGGLTEELKTGITDLSEKLKGCM